MKFTELFSHIHQGSCTYVHSVIRSWVSEQVALCCEAQGVIEHRISDQVDKVHFCFTTFYHPTASECQVATNGLLVLNLRELESLGTNLEKADYVHDQLHRFQLEAQEAILNDLIGRNALNAEEMAMYENWINVSIEKRNPLSAMPNRTYLKSIDHSEKIGVLLRSYLDEFLTAYTAHF